METATRRGHQLRVPTDGWVAGSFLPASSFAGKCVNPRSGTDPLTGRSYNEVLGTATDENNWLRSWSNDLYLWYDEIVDRDPGLVRHPPTILRSVEDHGNRAVRPRQGSVPFHIFRPRSGRSSRQSGVEVGLRSRLGRGRELAATPDRRRVHGARISGDRGAAGARTRRGSPERGRHRRRLVEHAGRGRPIRRRALSGEHRRAAHVHPASAAHGCGTNGSAAIRCRHEDARSLQHRDDDDRTGRLHAVQRPHRSGRGAAPYGVRCHAWRPVDDLVIDLRYNGGGLLAIASQVAYMVAGSAATAGQTFEKYTFNDKHRPPIR